MPDHAHKHLISDHYKAFHGTEFEINSWRRRSPNQSGEREREREGICLNKFGAAYDDADAATTRRRQSHQHHVEASRGINLAADRSSLKN